MPVFNEAEVLTEFHQRLTAVMLDSGLTYEVLYVNDGSDERCTALLQELREGDGRVALLELSRNFGKEVALSAGLDHANGEAVVVIDADLQDPPKVIPRFIKA